IFTIKHENVIMNVGLNTEAGFERVSVDGLPAGEYTMTQTSGLSNAGTSVGAISAAIQSYNAGDISIGSGYVGNAAAASISFEVLSVNTSSNIVVVRAESYVMDADGEVTTYRSENLTLTTAAKANFTGLGFDMGTAALALSGANAAASFDVGGRVVMHLAGSAAGGTDGFNVDVNIDEDWAAAGNWSTASLTQQRGFALDATALQSKDVHFRSFYLNTANGKIFQSDIKVSFNSSVADLTAAAVVGATFTAAYVGQTAKGDVALRDLDKFWDANGRFLLEDSQDITITQGDGTKAGITLNSTDTLNEVAKKLNDAIAFDLGQAKYVGADADMFVSFVDDATASSPESVEGTMVIRSVVAGKAGELAFAGDEDVINALSLNVIQDSEENEFRITVQDAHNGNTVASAVKITGNVLRGVVHENVDVEFDAMANVAVAWSDSAQGFLLTRDSSVYETTLHLADNSTVFQIGANEGEDMGISMGNMGARALGVDSIVVTDRESAARSITVIDNAIDSVSTQRSALGAYQNRLDHTINNLTVASQNLTSAESRIRDLDMAKEMMNFTKLNILSQAGTNMLAQANQLPQNVLSLLR
ncbi:flagellin, partial [Dethiosulfovibrio faecalis]|uniref:flagellin n=1 Tax=Dethiosulfovibrio faecalis TaxID=2720018 RepID=UPI00237CFB32